MSNPKADLHNINAHIKFDENPLRFTHCPESKIRVCCGQITVKNRRNSTISNPKTDVHNVNAHTKFGENPLILVKLSSRNENTDVSRADNSVNNWRNLPISNPRADLYNINAHTKFGENTLIFTKVIIRKLKYGSVAGR